MPDANSRYEGATDSACKSPILLRDEIGRRNNAFKVKKGKGKALQGNGQIPRQHTSASCRPQPQRTTEETRYQGVFTQ